MHRRILIRQEALPHIAPTSIKSACCKLPSSRCNVTQVRRRDGALPALEQAGAKRTKIAEIVVNQSASADVRAPEKSVYVGNLAPQVSMS